MKVKLFSKTSLLVSLKALGSSLVSQICSVPLWALTMFFINKQMYAVGGILGILSTITSFLFFGWLSSNWWKWR